LKPKKAEELILGIDPGLRVTGYGLVRKTASGISAVEFGVVKSTASNSLSQRLFEIVSLLGEIIEQYQPDVASVEQIFHSVNAKTALLLGHARGAILTELSRHGIKVYEYTPTAIKQAVVGYGRAEKSQVAEMCKLLLNLKEDIKPHDASDALAAAICHLNSLAPYMEDE
jgi:crossover junction endodeoxyribonuclease RuvC